MTPTQRSVIARLRYRSLDGRWSEVSLCKATGIRVFPRNAVMERNIFTAERKISSQSTPLINSAEHHSSLSGFWFSSSVKFVCAIFLRDTKRGNWGLYLYIAHFIWVESVTGFANRCLSLITYVWRRVIFLVFLITSSCFSPVFRKSCSQSAENSTHVFFGPYGVGGSEKVL